MYIKRVSGENLEQLQREIDHVLDQDLKATGLLSVPEFGSTTGAVLRAELGNLARSTLIDQIFAYVGLDQKAQTEREMERADQAVKARQRPSAPHTAPGRVTEHSSGSLPFYQRLVARGMKKGMAGVAVMRNMLSVAVHLIQTQERYDPGKVDMQAGS